MRAADLLEMVMFPWSNLARIQGLQRRPEMGRSYPVPQPRDKSRSKDSIERGSRSGDWVDQIIGTQRQYTRLELYAIYREMDMDPLITAVLDAYAEDATQRDFENGRTVWPTARNAEVKKIILRCLDRMQIEDVAFPIVRSCCKMGDQFERVVAAKNAGILHIRGYDPWDVARIEDEDGRLEAFSPCDAEGRPAKVSENAVPFYKVLHFRLRGHKRNDIYGTSLLWGSREKWRQLQLIEDQIVLQRLLRRPDRLLILMDVGGMPLAEAYEECVAPDSWIDVPGGVMLAEDVMHRVNAGEEMFVRSAQGWDRVKSAWPVQKKRKTWHFSRGLTLVASEDHPVATWDDEDGFSWKNLGELEGGENIVVRDAGEVDAVPEGDLAYLVGLFVGDGHWQQRHNTDYAVYMLQEKERGEGYVHIASIIEAIDEEGWTRGWSEGRLCVKSPVLFSVLQEAGFSPGSKTRNMPKHDKWLLSLGLDAMLAYVQGVMDAEAHSSERGVSVRMVDRFPLEYIQKILWRVGIQSSLGEYEQHGKPLYMLSITGRDADEYTERIGFRLSTKNDRKPKSPRDRNGTSASAQFIREAIEIGGFTPDYLAKCFEVSRGRIYQLKCGVKLLSWKKLLSGISVIAEKHYPNAHFCNKYFPMKGFCAVQFEGSSENAEGEDLIDFTVEGGESFVANGILTHNCKNWEDRIYREHNVDPVSGLFTSQGMPLHEARDLILPIGQDNNTRIENLPATTGNDLFRDFELILGRLLGGLRIPKGYLGFEGQYEPNMSLGKQDVRFAKTATRIQRAFLVELVRACMIDLAFHNLDPFAEENAFDLHMSPVSAYAEIERAELLQMRVDLMDRLARLGQDLQFNREVWNGYVLEEVGRLPKDMVDKLTAKDEGAAMEAVEALKEDPKALAGLTLIMEGTPSVGSSGVVDKMKGGRVAAQKELKEAIEEMGETDDMKAWENLKPINTGAERVRSAEVERAQRRLQAIRGLARLPVVSGA